MHKVSQLVGAAYPLILNPVFANNLFVCLGLWNLKSKMKLYLNVKVCLQSSPGHNLNGKVAWLAQVKKSSKNLKALE